MDLLQVEGTYICSERVLVAKFTDQLNQSAAGRFDLRVIVNCLQVLVSS